VKNVLTGNIASAAPITSAANTPKGVYTGSIRNISNREGASLIGGVGSSK
jgi:hypothetical protein